MLFFRIVLLALLSIVACDARRDERPKIVVGKNVMPVLNRDLPDDAFWSDFNAVLPGFKNEVRKVDFFGVHLDGPRIVELNKRSTLPLFGLRRASLEEAFYLRLESSAVIVGISKTDNSVFAGMAWENKSAEPDDFTPPKDGFPEGTSISPFKIEVRDRLEDFPWTPGGKSFILYLFDQQSNPVDILFQKELPDIPSLGKPIQSGSQLVVHPEPDAIADHSFSKHPESPAIPPMEGISLRIAHKLEGDGAQKCIARGAFRLKPLAGEVLDSQKSGSLLRVAAGSSAILPITLLVLGEKLPGPFMFPIRCPAIPAVEKDFVTGYFNVNLMQMEKMFGIPQRYVARALHGSARSEPEIFSLR